MDTYEATKTVMSRVQNLDPENASKIMGYILIQDQGEKEMIRLAFCPEALLLSYINQAKSRLGLPSNTPSPNPSPPLSYPIRPNNPFPQNSPRIMIPNNGFHFSRPRPISHNSIINGSGSPSLHFYGGDDFEDQSPFLDDSGLLDPVMSPGGRSDSLVFPYGEDAANGGVASPHPFHRRSCSVNDAAFLSNLEESANGGGFMWRPCMYFARGFCKNGGSCKFLHGGDMGGVEAVDVGSPSNNASGFDELLRMKALQQQRFAMMASGGHHSFGFNKCMDALSENLRSDLSAMGFGAGSSSARQIYLTFPADSTFKEEDVSIYFSMFGPVQDVRIPYQQKRMFGFVTFLYPETVKLILAKGNPHFVCDSRVLVKPYKEKGKVREKKHHQHHHQFEREEYPACLSPSGVDSGEQFDLPFAGSRMLFSPQEMMLRRKLEQEAELQHAIELQGRRMMNLQLMDLKDENHNYLYPQRFPYSSPRQSQLLMNQHAPTSSDSNNHEGREESDGCQEAADEKLALEGTESFSNKNSDECNQPNRANTNDSDLHGSFEHILPDNLFASPTKSVAEHQSVFSQADDSTRVTSITSSNSSPLTMASLKSCYLQMPRFSSGQEAIEM